MRDCKSVKWPRRGWILSRTHVSEFVVGSGEREPVSTKLSRHSWNEREREVFSRTHDIMWPDRRELVGFSCSGIP